MKAYKKEVGKKIEPIDIDNDLKTFKDFVGGYIEAVSLAPFTYIICNEDGKELGLEPNFVIVNEHDQMVDTVVGNVLFVGFNGIDDFDDITDVGMNMILKKIRFID